VGDLFGVFTAGRDVLLVDVYGCAGPATLDNPNDGGVGYRIRVREHGQKGEEYRQSGTAAG